MSAKIYNNVTSLIGNTPIVRLNRITPTWGNLYVKLESFNPASSVKDRIAVNIVDQAEKAGLLKPGGTIIEATSGNTGVALAMVGAARGYKVIITMPESMSKERRALMRAFGAKLVLTPAAKGMQGTVDAAEEILAKTENAILANQFANDANWQAHYQNTAVEIWEAFGDNIDAIVAGVGTGGTVTGIGKALKEKNPTIKIIGVEPEESPLLTRGKAAPHKIQGIGANFVPKILDLKVVDEIIRVSGEAAFTMSRNLASQEGVLVGISAGAALEAAKQLGERPEYADKNILAILPDTGERYLSTPLFADFMD